MKGILEAVGEIRFRSIALVGIALFLGMAGLWWLSSPLAESAGQTRNTLTRGPRAEKGPWDKSETSIVEQAGQDPDASVQIIQREAVRAERLNSSGRQPVRETGETGVPVGDYAVQVGAFRNRSAALARSREIQSLGFDAYLGRHKKAQDEIYRVLIGRAATRDQASVLKEALKRRGIAGFIQRLD